MGELRQRGPVSCLEQYLESVEGLGADPSAPAARHCPILFAVRTLQSGVPRSDLLCDTGRGGGGLAGALVKLF